MSSKKAVDSILQKLFMMVPEQSVSKVLHAGPDEAKEKDLQEVADSWVNTRVWEPEDDGTL